MFYIHVHGKPGGSNSSRGSNTIVLIEYLAAVTVFLYYSGQGRPQGLKMWTHNRWGAERA